MLRAYGGLSEILEKVITTGIAITAFQDLNTA